MRKGDVELTVEEILVTHTTSCVEHGFIGSLKGKGTVRLKPLAINEHSEKFEVIISGMYYKQKPGDKIDSEKLYSNIRKELRRLL